MEIWNLYKKNKNGKLELTDLEQIRGEKIPDGFYHLVVHVWIKNSKGEYIISRRSEDRKRYPLLYECVGGSVVKGETSLEGALRETIEEVGVKLEPVNGKLIYTKIRDDKYDIMDVWNFSYDGNLDLSNATTNEVIDVEWMTYQDIVNLYKDNLLVPTLGYFFELNAPKTHQMNLNPHPFSFIKNNLKDIEMRLNDEKRKKLSVGDVIVFKNTQSDEELKVLITGLHKYKSFNELYDKFDKTRIGYLKNEDAHPDDMLEYYTKEDIQKYGTLGIEVKCL